MLTMAEQYKVVLCSIELRHFQWPWTTPNPDFKVTPLFNAEYLRNSTTYRHSHDEKLIETHAPLTDVISSDVEWPSAIFNETNIARFLCDSWASWFIRLCIRHPR